jgi:hypothetical protein
MTTFFLFLALFTMPGVAGGSIGADKAAHHVDGGSTIRNKGNT